jgi:uncharacterized protein
VKFWDASAIVPLLFEEVSTPSVKRLSAEDPAMLIWWGTWIEVASALARLVREKKVTVEESDLLRTRMESTWRGAAIVQPSARVLHEADGLLFRHVLRAGDAFQLAAARAALRDEPDGFGFVTFDYRLRLAAKAEGFTIYPS